jgi:predicted nucleic acid-binding protein
LSVAYADASALVKLVVAEPEGPALRDHLGRHEHVVTSVVGAVELVRVGRRVRGPGGARDAEELVAGLAVIPVTDEVRRRASVLDPPGLGTLDAIHLASALAPGGVQAFYCYDPRLCEAAAATGLPVESPGA